jgi:Lactate racemase N-terminal domain
MRRVPLLSGSRVVHVPIRDGDVVLRPPAPPTRVVDVPAAVRDALSFPLSGEPLDSLARPGARVTIVVEPPALPVPGAQIDPRPLALATVLDELERLGIRDEDVTILVAGGLSRRAGRRELERLLPPPDARTFRGHVLVHDAAASELAPLGQTVGINPAVVEADVALVVSSAETVVHGGPGALLAACDAATVRAAAGARSLVQASGEPVWERLLAVEAAVGSRVRLLGLSLVLDHPRLAGRFRDYPHEPAAWEHVSRSPFRLLYSRLPGALRRSILRDQSRTLAATAAFAGWPSIAHVEALVRTIELRRTRVDGQLDALVVGVPWIGPHAPREPLNPITSAAIALGHALRHWRDAFPVRAGGTLVLLHSLTRSFAHGMQAPYRVLFDELASAGSIVDAERASAADSRALDDYRAGRACHPLLPYADWAGCQPALAHLGRVIVAGSRDAVAARALGFVPSHSVASALDMAHGVAGGGARVGILLAPPYPPLEVGQGEARLAPTPAP